MAGCQFTASVTDSTVAALTGRCRADWLMLRQKAQKHRHCGAIMTGTKNITSEGNTITLQFHTDENDNTTQNFQYFSRKLKGFWLHFVGRSHQSLTNCSIWSTSGKTLCTSLLKCQPVTPL